MHRFVKQIGSSVDWSDRPEMQRIEPVIATKLLQRRQDHGINGVNNAVIGHDVGV